MSADLKYFNLDYFNFTYFKEGSEDLWQSFLSDFPEFYDQVQDMVILEGGKGTTWGYNNVFCFTDFITVRYDDRDSSKGVCVSITSQGLESFLSWFQRLGEESIRVSEVFKILKERGCRPSRIDLCFDDYSKKFTPDQYERWLLEGYFNTRMKKHGFFCDDNKGYTFYLGNRRKKLIRIYDKNKESDGFIDAIRYEFELHGYYAQAIFDQIIEEDVPAFGDLILDSFRIINPDSNENITRCEMLVEWEDFIKSSLTQNFVEVKHYRGVPKPEKFRKWFEKNLIPSLKGFIQLYGKEWLNLQLEIQQPSDKWRQILKSYDLL